MNPILSGIIRPLSPLPQRLAIASGLATLLSAASAAEQNVTVTATTGGALRSIGRGVSINDRGDIGFMAATEQGHNVFCVDGGTGERRAMMNGVFVLKAEGEAPSQTFSEYVQVNNQREVAAQRRMNALVLAGGIFGTMTTAPLTYVERWPCHGNRANPGRIGLPNSLFVMGDGGAGNGWLFTTFLNPVTGGVYPSPFNQDGGFSAVMGAPAMNNSGQMVCSTLRGSSNWFITTRPGGFLGAPSNTGVARPQLADNGFFTLRVSDDPNTAIYWFSYDYGTFDQAVHSGNGFGAKSLPGIDDAGTLIVFCADLSAAGAAQLDTQQSDQAGLAPINPGPGLFESRKVGTRRFFRRLAGVAGNGHRDPGETWVDTNANGEIDAGEDLGIVTGFNYQSRACVNGLPTGFSAIQSGGYTAAVSDYLAAFAGTTSGGAPAVFTVEIPKQLTSLRKAPALFVKGGEPIAGLNGTPVEFELHDAVNSAGVIACWTKTSTGTHAILSGKARAAKHLHVLTHGLGNADNLKIGPTTWAFSGFGPDFLAGWHRMKDQITLLPYETPGVSAEKLAQLDGAVISYVSNWSSSDGWLQAAAAIIAMQFLPSWEFDLRSYAINNRIRSAIHAMEAAERIVGDLDSAGLLSPLDPPQIHLIGHSRGAAVNARVARLLYARGIGPAQYTALDGYSTDWPESPIPSNILADINITAETAGIDGMRKVNVRVEDGLDEYAVRTFLQAIESAEAGLAAWLGLSAPRYADATVADLEEIMRHWQAPNRAGFDNYVLSGCSAGGGFTNHLTITAAYTDCDRMPGLRALLDSPLGIDLLLLPAPPAARTPRDNGNVSAALPSIRDGDFEALGALAASAAAKPIPAGLDPVIATFVTAMKRSDFILSSSWDLTGSASLIAVGGGHAARMEQSATDTSMSQTVQIPPGAGSIAFDLSVMSAKAGDTLQVFAGSEVIGAIPLLENPLAHPSFSLFGFAGKLTTIGFRLGGAPGAAASAVTIDNIVVSSGPGAGEPQLSVAYNVADRAVDLTLIGTPGRTYRVQASPDLLSWEDIDSPMSFPGSKVIRNTPPAGALKRYYRVAW